MPHLTAQHRETYWHQGALWPIPALAHQQALALGSRLVALRDEIGQSAPGQGRALSFFPWEEEEHPLLDFARPLARHPVLTAIAGELLGPHLLLRNCDIFVKSPPSGPLPPTGSVTRNGPIDWHRDDPFCPAADGMLTVWLALSDVTGESGPVRYQLGSHRVGTPSTSLSRGSFSPNPQIAADLAKLPVEAAGLRAGEVIVHHANVVHGSDTNQSPSERIGVALRYLAPDVPKDAAGCGAAAPVTPNLPTDCEYHLRDGFTINWWS